MSSLSSYSSQIITDWILGKADPPTIGNRYLALFDGDPETTGLEVTDDLSSEGRQELTSAMDSADTDGLSENTSDIDFGSAIAVGQISHLAIFDSASGGNLLASQPLDIGTQQVAVGDSLKIATDRLTFSSS